MLKNHFYLYAFLAWNYSVLAVPASGANNQIDTVYDTTKIQGDQDMSRMFIGMQSCEPMGGIFTTHRNTNVMRTSVMQSFDKEIARANPDCNTCRRGSGAPKSIVFYAVISGQLATESLGSVEGVGQGDKIEVRAYPASEAHADQAYVLNLEARIQLAKLFEHQQIESQLIGFVDTSAMTENRNTWVDGLNPNALTGAGIGFNFSYINSFEVKTYVAHKLANDAAVSARKPSNRVWIQLFQYF